MKRHPRSVIVRVPATTANLGSGFDTLGVALQLYNHVRLTPNQQSSMRLESVLNEAGQAGARAMMDEAAQLFFQRSHIPPFGCDVHLYGDVPPARGLGSSVTLRLGMVAGLNALTDAGLRHHELLELVTTLEGHPDNAAPGVYGGFTVAGQVGDTVRCVQFPVSARARFVALIPRFEIKTKEARTLVPDWFSRADTVHSMNRAALVTAAFASGDLSALQGLFEDRIHQPYRSKLIPELDRVIQAGEEAGAIGGWLSGSGSTIICLTQQRPVAVGRAMQRQMPDSDIEILVADSGGVRVRW